METELKSLEEKINQFVQLCHRQRSENIQLRQQLAGATNENKHLSEKINAATIRLESLLDELPGNKWWVPVSLSMLLLWGVNFA